MAEARCVYADTAPAPPDTIRFAGTAVTDVAVIGGGFTGISAALHLAEAGLSVTILEAHTIGWGASGRNGGQVNPGLMHDPEKVEHDFGPDLGKRMVQFAWNAPNRVFELVRRHNIECDARQTGTIRAAFTRADATKIERTAAQCGARGMPIEFLDRDAIGRASGTRRYINALLDRRGGMVNPLAYARGLAAVAIRAGATIHTNSTVRTISRARGRWQLETSEGRLDADKLVIATNAYTDDLWPSLRRSLVPVYSAIICTAPLPEDLASQIMPERPVIYEKAGNPVYFRIDGQRRLLFGGEGPLREVQAVEEIAHLQRYAVELYPSLSGIRWTHFWSGQFAATTDAYLHFHEPAENVVVCLGYNGRGVAMSTAMGGEIARRLTGTPREKLNMPITPINEIWAHGLWKFAVRARLAAGSLVDAIARH